MSIPDSLRTDLAWCLWAFDPENQEVQPIIQSEMRRRGMHPAEAPPPDVAFLRGVRPVASVPDTSTYDVPPELVTKTPAVYPEMARQAQIEGTVVLRVLVGPDGRVKDVKLVKSVNYLDAAAKDAVMRWIYKPALLKGQAVPAWIDVNVEFKL